MSETGVSVLEPWVHHFHLDFPGGAVVKDLPANAGDVGLIPGQGRSPREECDNPLQYSCLENSMDSGAWWATVHEVEKSWVQLLEQS